ncbi:MAG: hypothetical protein E7254_04965 [Lachnospiraceae bacterium]|nr:hypothetical protein [Lachnospiraceae bacterium]
MKKITAFLLALTLLVPYQISDVKVMGGEEVTQESDFTDAAEQLVEDGRKLMIDEDEWESESAVEWIEAYSSFIGEYEDVLSQDEFYYDILSEIEEYYSEDLELDDDICKVVAILETVYLEGDETIDNFATALKESNTEYDDEDMYGFTKIELHILKQLELQASKYDYMMEYYFITRAIKDDISGEEYIYAENLEKYIDSLYKMEQDIFASLTLQYMLFKSYGEGDTSYEKLIDNVTHSRKYAGKVAEVLNGYDHSETEIPFYEYVVNKCNAIKNGQESLGDYYNNEKIFAVLRASFVSNFIFDFDLDCALDGMEIIIDEYTEPSDKYGEADTYLHLVEMYQMAQCLEDSAAKTKLLNAITAAFEADTNPDFDTVVECLEEMRDASTVEITGCQINTTFGGHRMLYSVDDPFGSVTEVGMIYGIASETTVEDMVVGSTADSVYSFKATENGKIASVTNSETKQAYAMTMIFIDTANYYNAKLRMRAYVKLSNGEYKYSDIVTTSVFDIASSLYSGKSMPTKKDHDYLYNHILKKCNPQYATVAY